MQECKHKQSLCDCIDWKNDDLTAQVNHLMNYFNFSAFELKYTTLEPEENRRLCKVGRCRICHSDLCIGKELPGQAKSDELLTEVYRWMFQMWNPSRDSLSDGTNCFTDMFLSVFHENDREFVSEWLCNKARNISPSCDEEG